MRAAITIAILLTLPNCGLVTRCIIEHHEWQLNRKSERGAESPSNARNAGYGSSDGNPTVLTITGY